MVDRLRHEIGFVYGIQSLDLIKVGVARDINKRLNDMRALNPHGCDLVFFRRTFAPYTFEKRMHELLSEKAVGREWFRITIAELRQAATKAKSSAVSAQTATAQVLHEQAKLAHGWHSRIKNPDKPLIHIVKSE